MTKTEDGTLRLDKWLWAGGFSRLGHWPWNAATRWRVAKGHTVRVYNVAKTVADCFKYRNKIGLDVALEALHEARRAKKASADALWRYAKINRVANVMRPYLEAVA